MVIREAMAAITPIHKVKPSGELMNMSRTFIAYHPYHPYDPYLRDELNQTSLYYSHLTIVCDKSKDGKARKDHVIQTFWYESESKSGVFHYLLLPLSTLID
jgi:hypothetical protein